MATDTHSHIDNIRMLACGKEEGREGSRRGMKETKTKQTKTQEDSSVL